MPRGLFGGLLAMLLAACVPTPRLAPSAPTSVAALQAADAARIAAMVAVDTPALDAVLADDLSYAHSNGLLQDKGALLDALRQRVLVYRRYDTDDVVARRFGDAGVVTGTALIVVEAGGVPRNVALRYTATYVLRARRWQLVAYQSTPLPAR
jgi:ketosteroid isomerase-like protein